jgi:POT family proton-dependent oligopeptide transporter
LAAQVFGLYVGLVYFTPVIGGWIGDRFTGRRVAVAAGALLMTFGHFALAFDASFLLALLLLILGAGLLRGNLVAQIKSLYDDDDPRAADAFQVYYVAVNIAAFVAPLVTGTLAQVYGWHTGFACAGFGMLVGLVVYLVGQKHLPPDRARAVAAERAALTPDDRRRVGALLMLWPLLIGFWIAQTQIWNVYNLWVRDHVSLGVGGFSVPVPWIQGFDGLAPVIVMPLFLALWRRQAARGTEPDTLGKMAIGCVIFGLGVVWLAAAPLVAGADGRAPLLWAIAFHLISNVGWLYFTPLAVALYATTAPPALRGTMIGVQTLSIFVASILSGRLGSLYEVVPPPQFWMIHAAIVGAAGVGIWLVRPFLRARLAGTA